MSAALSERKGNLLGRGRRRRLAFGLAMVVAACALAWLGRAAVGGVALRGGVFILVWLGALGILQAHAWT